MQVDAGEESCLCRVSLKHRVREERTPEQVWMGFFTWHLPSGTVKRHSSSDGTEDLLTC